MLLSSLSCLLLAAAQSGVIDQQSPDTGVDLSGPFLSYFQQEVRVGRDGILEGFQLTVTGPAGSWISAVVRRGAGWRDQGYLHGIGYGKTTSGPETLWVDTSSSRIPVKKGELLLIEATPWPGAAVRGSYVAPPGTPLYPEELYLNGGANCYADCGYRLAFRTFVLPCVHERLLDQFSPSVNAAFYATVGTPLRQRARAGMSGRFDGFELYSWGRAGGTVTCGLRLGADWYNHPPVFVGTGVNTTNSFDTHYFDLSALGLNLQPGDHFMLECSSSGGIEIRGSYREPPAPPYYPEPLYIHGLKAVREHGFRVAFRSYVTPPTGPGLHEPYPGAAGATNVFTACRFPAGSGVKLAYGTLAGSTALPGCPGRFLDIANPVLAAGAVAGTSGQADLAVFVPAAAAGLPLLFQAFELAGCTLSPRLDFTFP